MPKIPSKKMLIFNVTKYDIKYLVFTACQSQPLPKTEIPRLSCPIQKWTKINVLFSNPQNSLGKNFQLFK